ncbi:MAG: sugar ABC transporter permease [Lachnospiraceae bacterium]|jgi:raffinose/stachyose/melibiose transport system permease protein|nr:sugar ABC transporter permease [Lachnospiraceae bacterium]
MWAVGGAKRRAWVDRFTYVGFLVPMVVPFLVTVAVPFGVGVYYSFTDWTGLGSGKFVGLANYVKIFGQNDYLYSLGITAAFTVANMLAVNVLAFLMALLCTQEIAAARFCRAVFFVPNLIGGIVLGYVWQFIFNKVFAQLGGVSMLTDPTGAFFAIAIVSTWQYAGYIMMIYITGLQSIPGEVLQAAGLDGAGALAMLFRVKIPMVMNTFTVCLFLTLVNSFKQFDLNFAITGGAPARILGGKAIPSTEFLALNIYNTAIVKNNYALGQAKAIVFFVALAAISLMQVWIGKKSEVEL